MKRRLFAVLAAVGLAAPSTAVPAEVAALQTLYCIPQLPAARVRAEISRLLDGPECEAAMVKENIGTHILAVGGCRSVAPVADSDACKIFSFQVNNATSVTPQASGARFVLKGAGRWCRRSSGDWYPDEPDQFALRDILTSGPPLPDITCRVPEAWYGPRPVVAFSPPNPPASAPAPVAPSPAVAAAASPPPPFAAPFRATSTSTVGTYLVAPPPVPAPPSAPVAAAGQPPAPVAPAASPPPPVQTAGIYVRLPASDEAASAPTPPLCLAGYVSVCTDLVALRYLETNDVADVVFGRAVREFLNDEREAATLSLPPVGRLQRLTAAALARSRATSTCPTDPRVAGPIVACGRS